jgi:4-hydroxybenzoate polyprenyltransferase
LYDYDKEDKRKKEQLASGSTEVCAVVVFILLLLPLSLLSCQEFHSRQALS